LREPAQSVLEQIKILAGDHNSPLMNAHAGPTSLIVHCSVSGPYDKKQYIDLDMQNLVMQLDRHSVELTHRAIAVWHERLSNETMN